MPLFGSRTPNKDQLFESWAKVVFRGIQARAPLPELADRQTDWWSAGIITAKAATGTLPSLERAWDKGSKEKAAGLALLFTLPMVPRFYRWTARTRAKSADDRLKLRNNGIRSVAMYEMPLLKRDEMVDDYIKLGIQFEYSEDHRETTGETRAAHLEGLFLLSRALTLCGAHSVFDIGRVVFPVNSQAEFVDQGGRFDPLLDSEAFAVEAIVNEGAVAMLQKDKWDSRH
jgi:hypothetical protein